MELKGKVALITGAATGIGNAVAMELARAGVAAIAVSYRRNQNDAEKLAEELRAAGARSLAVRADVREDAQVREMVQKTGAAFGRLDILVNNAGITHWVALKDLEGLTDEIWDEILDINLKGAFRCVRAAAPLLRQHRGMVINVASTSGVLAPATISSIPYGAAKAALIHVTRLLAVALAPDVRVNAVAPAFTDTKWMRDRFGKDYDQIVAKTSTSYPLGRIAAPEEVARAVVGLVTGGDFVTGQTLMVDGGLSLS